MGQEGKRAGSATSVIAAAMLGFATATELDPLAQLREGAVRIESSIDTDAELPSPHFVKKARESERLPSFSGRVRDLQPQDLAGYGALLRHFAPQILQPYVTAVTVHNSTTLYAPPSDLISTFDFDNAANVLGPGPSIVMQAAEPLETVIQTIDLGIRDTPDFIDVITSDIKRAPDLSKAQASAIERALAQRHEELEHLVREEFSALRTSLQALDIRLTRTERALVETPETLGWRINLKEVVTGMPQRLVEDVADEGVKTMARKAAKALAKLLVAAALS